MKTTDNMDRDNRNADSFNTDKIDIEELKALLKKTGKLFADRNAAAHTREKGVADYVTEVDFAVQQFQSRAPWAGKQLNQGGSAGSIAGGSSHLRIQRQTV